MPRIKMFPKSLSLFRRSGGEAGIRGQAHLLQGGVERIEGTGSRVFGGGWFTDEFVKIGWSWPGEIWHRNVWIVGRVVRCYGTRVAWIRVAPVCRGIDADIDSAVNCRGSVDGSGSNCSIVVSAKTVSGAFVVL